MIDTDPRESVEDGGYAAPTFRELVEVGEQLGLVSGYEADDARVQMRVVGQVFHLAHREAELMLHGILLGYFAAQAGDDVSAADWDP